MNEPHNNEIDRAFFELIESLELDPSEQVWEGVRKEIPPPQTMRFFGWLRTISLVCLLVIVLGVWKTPPTTHMALGGSSPQKGLANAFTNAKNTKNKEGLKNGLNISPNSFENRTSSPTPLATHRQPKGLDSQLKTSLGLPPRSAARTGLKPSRSSLGVPGIVDLNTSSPVANSTTASIVTDEPSAPAVKSTLTPDLLKNILLLQQSSTQMPEVSAITPIRTNHPSNKWAVGIYATTYTSQHPITDIDDYLNIPHNEKEETERLLSVGIQLQRYLAPRFSVGIGLEYQQVLHINPKRQLPAAFDATGTKYFAFESGLGGFAIKEPLVGANLMQVDTLDLVRTRQYLSMVQIPLVLRYKILHYKRWSVEISAGGALVIPLHDEINLRIRTGGNTEQTVDVRKLGFIHMASNYRFGLGLNYRLSPHVRLSVEPVYLGYFSKISTYPQAVLPPLAFSLNTGLRINLK